MQIDHVILAVGDLADAAARVEEKFGLHSTEGGRHPGYGTANRLVSLGGNQYLELMGIVGAGEAAQNPLGQRVAQVAPGWLGWCVSVTDIDAVAGQLGLPVLPMSRSLPDGSEVSWRLAGLDASLREPWLPFFISWDDPQRHPGREPQPAGGAERIASLTIEGAASEVDEWLGGAGLPIEIVPGSRGLIETRLATPRGELTVTL